jgi:hypothetical protein
MRQHPWPNTALFAMACIGMMFLFHTTIASPTGAGAIPATRTAKCTIDMADGKGADCTLIKANHEWILWSNSTSKPRSIHFKTEDNPFSEKSCWDVEPGARARSGPIALNAVSKTYVSFMSSVPCNANPPSAANRGTPKVVIQ